MNRSHARLLLALFPLSLAFALGGGRVAIAEESELKTKTVERVVAVVNSEIILLSEVKDRASQMGQPVDDNAPAEVQRMAQKVLRQVLDKMVDEALIAQQAQELKLAVEEAEVDRAVEEVKKANNLDTAQFAQALADQGFSIGSFRRDMRKQILRMKAINTAVRSRMSLTEEDLKAFYEQNLRQAGTQREAKVKHVLVALAAGMDAKEIESRRKLAAKIVEDARGGTDFGKLAKQYSDDAATKDEGGELGWVKEDGALPDAMREIIFQMEAQGEVRGPVKTDRGFEVVQLVERRAGDARPFEEVREQIRAKLSQEQIEKQTVSWVAELRKKAHIEIRL